MSDLHELTIERVIDAPVAAVWQAWTEHIEEWFCPRPWRTRVEAMELRPGGRSAVTLLGPDGEVNALEGIYLAVEPERLIVSTDAVSHDWRPQGPFMVRLDTFADAGDGRTRYTATARHWTAEAKAQHQEMGFAAGWGAVADQLAEVAKRIA